MLRRAAMVFAILSGAFAGRALACKCDHPLAVEEARAGADLVFQGYPVARFPGTGIGGSDIPGWKYLFVVEKQWKGTPRAVETVFSGYDGCGLWFDRNVSMLVFASDRAGFETSRCDSPSSAAHLVVPNDPVVAALGPPAFEVQTPVERPRSNAFPWSDTPWISSGRTAGWPAWHWHPLLLIVAAVLLAYPAIRAAYADRNEEGERRSPPEA